MSKVLACPCIFHKNNVQKLASKFVRLHGLEEYSSLLVGPGHIICSTLPSEEAIGLLVLTSTVGTTPGRSRVSEYALPSRKGMN